MTKEDNLQENGKKHTLRSIAMEIEKDDIKPSVAKAEVQRIHDEGFVDTYFSKDDPNKMVFHGEKDNSLLTLDRLDSERTIQRSTWSKMREYIESAQGKKKSENSEKKPARNRK